MTRTAEEHEEQIRRWLANLDDERDGIALYEGLAKAEREEKRAKSFRTLAEAERKHAAIWEKRLDAAGRLPVPGPASLRIRAIIALARMFGTQRVLPMVIQAESGDMDKYARQPGIAKTLVAEEREHRTVLEEMSAPAPLEGAEVIAQRETWNNSQLGSIRAAIFGVNDGLISNTALILGVAAAGSADASIVTAGVAGTLAGAFSMAVGEYTSVASQRDLLARQIEIERRELRDAPEEEQAELVLILENKGLAPEQAKEVATAIFKDPEKALDTMVREELGIDPKDLGSPVGAAVPSFFAFMIGAILPLLPFVFLAGTTAAVASAVIAGTVLATIGAIIGFLSGTGGIRSAIRMVGLASIATGVTVAIGRAIGVTLG